MGMVERMGVNRKKEEARERERGIGGERRENNFQKFEILTASILCRANLHHRFKFRAGRTSSSGDMAIFYFS